MAKTGQQSPGRTQPRASASVSAAGMAWPAGGGRRPRPVSVGFVAVVAVTAFVALFTRLLPLSASLWHDEATTALFYVSQGPRAIFSGGANNHVLFSLLTWGTSRLLGESEPVLRLWSVVPGLLAVAGLAAWLWRRHGALAALLVALLGTVSPLLARVTTQARGYGLALLGLAASLVLSVRLEESERDVRRSGGFRGVEVLLGVAAVVTMCAWPLAVVPLAGHVGVLLWRLRHQRERLRRVVAVLAAAGVASALFLAPVLPALFQLTEAPSAETEEGGAEEQAGLPAPRVRSSAASGVEAEDQPGILGFATGLARQYVPGLPPRLGGPAVAVLLGVPALAGAAALLDRRRDPALLAHAVVPVLVLTAALVLALVALELEILRFFTVVFLHAATVVVLGAEAITGAVAARTKGSPARGVLGGIGLVLGVVLAAIVLRSAVLETVSNTAVPLENYAAVAEIVNGAGEGPVYTNADSRLMGLRWYLGDERLVQVGSRDGVGMSGLCRQDGPFVFVEHRHAKTGSGTAMDPACPRERGASSITVPQDTTFQQVVHLIPPDGLARD